MRLPERPALFFAGLRNWHREDLSRTAGIEDVQAATAALQNNGTLVEVAVSPTRTVRFHRQCLEQLCQRIATTLGKMHQRHPLHMTIDRRQLQHGFEYVEDAVFELAITTLEHRGEIRIVRSGIALKGHGPKLSQNEQKLLAKLIEDYRLAGLETPTVKQFQQNATKNQSSVPPLIALAAACGDLVQVTDQYYLHADVDHHYQQELAAALSQGQGLTVSQIREILNTSRKYAVPYCEYLDRIGFTRRSGDLRLLGNQPGE